ncbi:MAG: phenylacetic acid degradation bifunctional protein PaaZ [Actinobacteria bacterium]|nr:phenylacetic acid degradation bifunctional protein PaaZ [Actinomycetota bacterium]
MPVLDSFLGGKWRSGSGKLTALKDAATGVDVGQIPSVATDLAVSLEFARSVGGSELRELTFTERAQILKDLSKYLFGHIDEFVEVSYHTGATRKDASVDIDGGIGTLAVFASQGIKQLPDSKIMPDGEIEPLSKGGEFSGKHIYTPRRGVAVQINAYNFPVWGMLEKFAPAFLAGMPTLVKPASQTAYLTHAVFRKIIDSGILPEGSISLLAAGPTGLLESLLTQDTLAFTGSAKTASALRSHPAFIQRGARFNAEADSLNCSIMGPDVAMEDDEFDIFIDQIVEEMTIKAGQKCTAIRRVFVSEPQIDEVVEALISRLSDVVIGDPRGSAVTMGPLVSIAQREELIQSLNELLVDCRLVYGNLNRIELRDADSESGAFISPFVLVADDLLSATPHQVEPFGPVVTVMPYSQIEEAFQAAALGNGSLVASLVTRDDQVARSFVESLSPWHGRLLITNAENARASTGHGIAMPQMLHGGPGRAGGGEELGGLRSVVHYMQRTAVQGNPTLLGQL